MRQRYVASVTAMGMKLSKQHLQNVSAWVGFVFW